MRATSIILSFLSLASAAVCFPSNRNSEPQRPQSSLPSPQGSFKFILLGVGTQNYSCATSDSSSLPAAFGAIADLYDATAVLSSGPASRWPTLAQQGMTCIADHSSSGLGLRRVGNHFFNAALQPSFNVPGLNSFLLAKKVANVAAPSNACTGRNGAGAVDWLYLADNGLGGSTNVAEVYRYDTTGGKQPATCAGMPSKFTVDYAAEYWFYG